MRIALVVDPLTLSSRGGRHAPALATALIERGHEVRGFGAPPGVVPHSVEYKELNGLSRFEAQALIAYDGLSPTAFSAARVARRTDVPLILVEPGPIRAEMPVHERFLKGIGERLWGRYVRNQASCLVAMDPVARQHALDEGFDAERIDVLPTGIDLAQFRPRAGASTPHDIGGRVVLYAGPIETSIGLEVLIRAFARTLGRRSDWSLALIGTGEGKRSLRTMVARLGVSSNVHWVESEKPEDEAALFSTATAFVAPALSNRSNSRWVLSAMASGVPILCSDIPRFSWAVEDGETGLLVAPDDEPAWEAALSRLASAPVARERWGSQGRLWAEAQLNWDAIAASFETKCAAPAKSSPSEDLADAAP